MPNIRHRPLFPQKPEMEEAELDILSLEDAQHGGQS